MRILAIETIERRGTLALLTAEQGDCRLVGEASLPEKERTSCTLVPHIAGLLEQSRWDVRELDLICVASGPGSFTGLRIGVTTAKTLAFSTGAKLVGVHSLAALAAGLTDTSADLERGWAILDAQRQELFAASFSLPSEAELTTTPETKLLAIEDWLDLLQPGDLVTGPPLRGLADRIPSGIKVVDPQDWSPMASAVGKLGVQIFQQSGSIDPIQLVPNYYRKSAAEEKAEDKADAAL